MELEENERDQFLERRCAGDEKLRGEVESLLAFEKDAESFMERCMGRVAAEASALEHRTREHFTDSDDRSLEGQNISHYRVLSQLGSGGMGVVYEAQDLRLRRRVALKLLPENLAGDERAALRFQREARAASSLNHPGICTIYEVEEHNHQPVIVMELLEGKSLKDRINEGLTPPDALLDLGIQACDALAAAHAKGIVHRDIKPGNIFIVGSGRLKILDFGLAKAIRQHQPDDETADESLTGEGLITGTTSYMSPEQVRGEEVDARTDLFSLGVVLYEMATCQRPFRGKNSALLVNAILNAEPVPPTQLNSKLPTAFDTAILRALEKDRNLRYRSVADLRLDLQRLKEEQERKRKLAHVQWAAAALGIMLLLALTLAYIAWNEKRRAEANLQLAKTAVDESLSSAGRRQAREAADSAQMEEFRKELLEKAKDFYANYLARQDPGSEGIRDETPLTRTRLADVNRLLGKYQDAVDEYQLAIKELGNLVKARPDSPDYRRALAYAHNWLGETLRIWLEGKQGAPRYSYADAENEYNTALRLQQELVTQVPGNLEYQQEFARTYYNRGILHYDSEDYGDSEADFRHAIRLLEAVPDQKINGASEGGELSVPPSQDLARVYNNLATLLRQEKKITDAREFYEGAIGLAETLTKENPGNREYKLELAMFYNNLAALLWDQNELKFAKQRNHQATDLIEELATPAPQLESERAKAFMLYGLIHQLQHPEFHVMYTHLGDLYAEGARTSLQSGSLGDAQDALESLSRLLPELAEPDRTRLGKAHDDLEQELQLVKKAGQRK